jgi:hypothetical protein
MEQIVSTTRYNIDIRVIAEFSISIDAKTVQEAIAVANQLDSSDLFTLKNGVDLDYLTNQGIVIVGCDGDTPFNS